MSDPDDSSKTLMSGDDSLVPDVSESFEGMDVSTPPRIRIRKNVSYEMDRTFTLKALAEEFVVNEKCWSKRKLINTEEGEKQFFRCNQVKARGQQCSAAIYLLYDSTSPLVFLFRAEAEHDCDKIENKSGPKLTPEVKLAIEKLCDQKKKPLAILDHLVLSKLPVPKIYQIKNYMAQYKKSKFGAVTVSIAALRKILDRYSEIPETTDTPFVIHDLPADAKYFRFFMTSKALMKNAIGAVSLNADATYKLMWQGFPLLVVGTTDLNKKLHVIGVAVCVNEREEDFAFMFSALKECALKLHNCIVAPTTIVCDAAKSISNAFKAEFGAETKVIMCWAHMLRAVKRKISSLVNNKDKQQQILKDIYFLQTISTVRRFQTARSLFVEKWSTEEDFIEYFTDEWITQNPNWYEGAMQRVPSTNNALEALNGVIKSQFTFRERLSLPEFIQVLENLVSQFSRRYDTDLQFATEPSIARITWGLANNWVKLKLLLKKKRQVNGATVIAIQSSEYNSKVKILSSMWPTLEDFKTFYNSKWYVTLASPDAKWLNALCSCPSYQKNFICKHIVGIAVRMGEVTIPDEIKSDITVIGGKRKRGRPASTKKAYIIQ